MEEPVAAGRDIRRGPLEEAPPTALVIDRHLLANGWTLRSPENEYEAVNFGDTVYTNPLVPGAPARGWIDALGDQMDQETGLGEDAQVA